MKKQCLTTLFVVAFLVVLSGIQAAAQADDAPRTSAWKDGHLQIDTAGVVGRSDVVLGQPNLKANQAMPLGNGRLGVAIWAEDGLTAQLNRADTWPARLSPGQVVIPGLLRLIKARNYSGRLNLYNGEFVEQGGGMSATAFVVSGEGHAGHRRHRRRPREAADSPATIVGSAQAKRIQVRLCRLAGGIVDRR